MTDQRRRRSTVQRTASADGRGGAVAPRVLPLGGIGSLAVSADAVRAKLGAWAGLCAPEERPDLDAAWREVLLVLGAVVESGRAGLGSEALPPWERDVAVPREPLDLQRRTALPREAVRRAVDRAISAELLDLVSRVGDELTVRIRSDVFADAPVVAAVDWDVVRDSLGTTATPVALLLVREIARRTLPERRSKNEAVSISLRELSAATGASKGTIQKTLGALRAAGLADGWTRDRVDTWHRLLPPAFGEVRAELSGARAPAGGLTEPAPSTSTVQVRTAGAPRLATVPPSAPAPADQSAGAGAGSASVAVSPVGASVAVSVYEVNGIRWPLPAGVRPQLEYGAGGAPVRRIGNLRLPTHRPADAAALVWFEVDGIAWDLPPGAQPELERDADGSYWYRVNGERWPFRT